MLNFCDFIQVFVFTTNHHLKKRDICLVALIFEHLSYSLIQMKCQGGDKYALSISVKFDQSTRRFGRISFARLFKLTKHIALLFYLLSPYLLSFIRGSRNVRKNMHIIKTIMKFYMHWSTVCGMTNSDAGGIRTHLARGLRWALEAHN